jgi:hypothetical protein
VDCTSAANTAHCIRRIRGSRFSSSIRCVRCSWGWLIHG